MVLRVAQVLPDLYEVDETAWLETMAELIESSQFADLDYPHLREYLTDMALRDRREVESRLATLLAHLLKWTYQPDRRSNSWRGTVVVQQQELALLAMKGVLRNHASAVLSLAFEKGVEQAVAETGLAAEIFPSDCPYTLEQLLSDKTLLGE